MLLSDTEVIGRKQHSCIWCGESVLKGEKHHRQVYKLDGEIQGNRYHAECYRSMLALWKIDRFACEDGFSAASFRRGTCEER